MSERAARSVALDTTTDVETPEHVRFRFRLAGPARRALAYAIDLAVRGGIAFVIALPLSVAAPPAAEKAQGASTGVLLLVVFLLEWFYYVGFDVLWSGRTPGRRALGLRVVKEGGHPIAFTDSVLRNLLRAADFLPLGYALGVTVMTWDRRFRRLGDLAAGTMVVVEDRAKLAEPLRISPPPTPSELEALPERLPLSAADLEAIELFLRRLGTLSPELERELAAPVAEVYARRFSAPLRDPVRFLALLYHRATGADRRHVAGTDPLGVGARP
jgi:uncharacterized RDD family membrane protein YckC